MTTIAKRGKTIKRKNAHLEERNVIPLANEFSHVSVRDPEEIMEWLNDHQYLSDKGITFREKFWWLFIKTRT